MKITLFLLQQLKLFFEISPESLSQENLEYSADFLTNIVEFKKLSNEEIEVSVLSPVLNQNNGKNFIDLNYILHVIFENI